MADQFLSQDEVDALLSGLPGDAQKTDKEEDRGTGGVREYKLESEERIARGRIPTLEIVNERCARNLRTGLADFMRRSPEVSVEPVRVIKYSTFLRDIAVPTSINIVSLAPLRGCGLVIFDPKLVFCVIDSLFGGSGKFQVRFEGREFSPTESRIIQRMLDLTLAELAKAWATLFRFEFRYQRSEIHTQFANVVSPSETVVATTFNVELGEAGGSIQICFPYSSLEPIRDLLYTPVQGAGQETDSRWLRQLTQQVQSADVELKAELANTQISVRDLMRLKAGDFVELPLREIISAQVGGVPVMECRYGTVNGRAAVRVERMLKYSQFGEPRTPQATNH